MDDIEDFEEAYNFVKRFKYSTLTDAEKEKAAQILKTLKGLRICAALELLDACKNALMSVSITYK